MANQNKEPQAFKFRVKPGMEFGPGGIYKAGAIVELTALEANGFLDKLIPLNEAQFKNELKVAIDPSLQFFPRPSNTNEADSGDVVDGVDVGDVKTEFDTSDESADSSDEFSLQGEGKGKLPKPKTQRKTINKSGE